MDEMDEATLVMTLNSLLNSLNIPLVLQRPTELTPSLILAIFESMLRTRLHISAETRKSTTYPARVEAMKIFIGVLEDDILGVNVGLSDIDPRRLAEGKRTEVLRVANTLCWLGKRMKYISQDGMSVGNIASSRDFTRDAEYDMASESPSLHSAASTSHDSSLFMSPAHSYNASQTTMSVHDATGNDDSFSLLAQSPQPRQARRDYVHIEQAHSDGLDDLSLLQSQPLRRASRRYDSDSEDGQTDDSFCHCSPDLSGCPTTPPPLRTSGHLETIDFEDEMKSYTSRRMQTSNSSSHSKLQLHTPNSRSRLSDVRYERPQSPNTRTSTGIITRHTSPSQYTLALLNERARLLSDLAKFRHSRS